ncbi:site-2 protease family protein [Pseudonocardia abyssalis]|jgi:Zn-dependent protease|uniref:Site-2 protease family protein n=1 Tax=Pseudonocardia abyssalis TaxID=2792008 RepID=A0ABS6UVM1_9PSEU|nr:site-2 protease family protein [Pseudonocardia abyssalis]MBW0116484.1 site-2 protease family protein [Pseudonocardia abyssalis]MBW0136016.1 site-2 protease family protein [Pseudonocardia abyssalis]
MRGVSNRVSPWFLVLVLVAVSGSVLTTLGTPVALTAGVVLLVLGGWAVSLCLHEFGHAYVAYRSGDLSVRDKGYLTLDIRRYTDPVLSFGLPVVFLLLGGIPLPGGAVWINHGAIRSRGARSLVSLAGPATNLVLGAVLTVLVATVAMPGGLAIGLSCLALIQVLAFVLNILPVPGLDGFGVLEPYLSMPARRLAARVRPWAPLVLFVLLIGVPGVSAVFFDLAYTVFDAVGGSGRLASLGYGELLFWR